MTLTRSPFYLRPMALADLPQIAEIEADSFPSAWPSSAYKREMERNNLARYVVAIRRDPPRAEAPRGWRWPLDHLRRLFGRERAPAAEYVAGFLGVWFMVDETHIVTVAVRPSERRQGVGELLLLAAFDLSREREIPALTLEVRASNAAAQALYEKYGFKRLGIRKRYYTDNNEDAVIMTTPSLDEADYASRVEASAGARTSLGQCRRNLMTAR
jgi:[ribosomal protein S18]-alanine N-acetyltransferase